MSGYAVPANIQTSRIVECYESATAITPTDNTQIGPFAAIYVGGAGDVTLCPANSTTPVTFKAVPVGTILRVRTQGVNATNTTATNLVGLG